MKMMLRCLLNRGKVRWTKCLTDVSTKTDQDLPQATTPLRKKRNVIPDVKTAIACIFDGRGAETPSNCR